MKQGRAHVIPDLRETILNTWRTNNRVTVFLVEHLPPRPYIGFLLLELVGAPAFVYWQWRVAQSAIAP